MPDLTPGTTYYFCAIASNSVGLGFGAVLLVLLLLLTLNLSGLRLPWRPGTPPASAHGSRARTQR